MSRIAPKSICKRSTSLTLIFALLLSSSEPSFGAAAESNTAGTATRVSVENRELSKESASSVWNQISRSHSPEEVTADDGSTDWQFNFGFFPTSVPSHATFSDTSPFFGILFTKPLYTPREIFNQCPEKTFDYAQIPSAELLARIEQSAKQGENCDAASALRTLFLSDLTAFEKIDGWNFLLRVLETEGAVHDFNIELSQYLKYKNPDSPELLEKLRFRQLKLYARFVPDRHVNPRGTLRRTTYASEYAAMLRLFQTSYPSSPYRAEVREMETKLFDDYILKFNIPVLPLVIPQQLTPAVVIQDQKAFTPLALAFDYPNRIWTANADFIDRVMKGQESLYHSICGCSYQAGLNTDIEFVADVDGLGYSRVESLEKAQDTCVRLAQQNTASRKGVAYTHQCSQTEVALDDKLLTDLKNEYEAALVRDKIREKSANRIIPSYQKVLAGALTVLFSAFTWRNRGGGPYALGSTQGARILFAVLPQTLIGATFGYLEDGWSGAKVGATAGALMTPALLIPWGRQMDVGRSNGDKWEDFALLNLRGLLQTLPAAFYLNSEGKDAAPVLLGGLGMGPCYFASWQWGENATVAKNWGSGLIDSPTAWGELCWGGTLGLGLMKSLTTNY